MGAPQSSFTAAIVHRQKLFSSRSRHREDQAPPPRGGGVCLPGMLNEAREREEPQRSLRSRGCICCVRGD
jgi:hypothetical protein